MKIHLFRANFTMQFFLLLAQFFGDFLVIFRVWTPLRKTTKSDASRWNPLVKLSATLVVMVWSRKQPSDLCLLFFLAFSIWTSKLTGLHIGYKFEFDYFDNRASMIS